MWSPCVSVRLSMCVSGVEAREHNIITCEIIDLASPDLVCGSSLARSRMSLCMGHPDLLLRSPQPTGASRPLWSSFL